MRLIDWQLAFEQHLLGESADADPAFSSTLRGGPRLDAASGLAIYHNAYPARLQAVLREDFSAVRYWLGDDEFASLSAAYVRRHPSGHFSLRWFGRQFPGFIREYFNGGQSAALAELARLEWAFTLAFDAPPGAPLSLADMAQLPAQHWPGLQVRLVASAQQMACQFNSLALWRASKAQSDFPGSAALPLVQVCLVWRQERVCQYRSLEPEEACALAGMVATGWSFSELCAELAVTYGEGAPLQAATWLKQWVQDGLLERRAP